MYLQSTIRLTIEKREHGKTVKREVFSLVDPPYESRSWWLLRGGKRSSKFEEITLTEFIKLFGKMVRLWLK